MPYNPLANIFNNNNSFRTGGQTTSAFIGNRTLDTEVLPYGGGTFNPAGTSEITPAPIFTPPPPPSTPAPQTVTAQSVTPPEEDLYARYRDPKTGEVMTPEEYAINLGNKVPKGTGDIPQYAGEALEKPDQTTAQLTAKARELTNFRNDIATGATDPLSVGAKSGIAYSPAELKAIESAYAGIYDPAINDVFERLQEKKEKEAQLAKREDRIFATNEAIRQWQATTGTKKTGSSDKDLFTQTQLNNGASNSGLGVDAFSSLDNDIKNFYINSPMGMSYATEKRVPMYQVFEEYFDLIEDGTMDADTVNEFIVGSTLPNPVKHYFVERLPLDPPEKEKSWRNIWGLLN